MVQRAVVPKEHIQDFKDIIYLGRDEIDEKLDKANARLLEETEDTEVFSNRGYRFELLDKDKAEALQGDEFEVIGWIDRTSNCPYDFILFDPQSGNYRLANLIGRRDEWPLFAIQDGRPMCSRSRMGSEWSCKLCVKYFNTVCKGR